MVKNKNKIKIWFIHNQEKTGYWTDNPDWIWEFKEMNNGDKFEIECKELTLQEFKKLEKSSHEFEGW